MIKLMLPHAGRKVGTGLSEFITVDIQCTNGHLGWATHRSAHVWQAQAALVHGLKLASHINHHRIDVRLARHTAFVGSGHKDPQRLSHLRSGQTGTFLVIHDSVHVFH